MRRALVLKAPKELDFEPIQEQPVRENQVLIRTLYSGVSAGTELSQYRGTNPFMDRRWDEQRRLFVKDENPSWEYPVRNLGYEECGEIVEVGRAVTDLKTGQKIFGTWNHRTHHVASAEYARERLLPDDADPLIGIFSHIGAVAINGVHDAQIRIGDTVAVFGLGVPGQIAAQAARASGATVIAIDPDEKRREMAKRLGAHETLTTDDVVDRIKDLTNGKGADACIEVSGAAPALGDAIRAVAYNSRVVALGFFQGEVKGLRLGEEFHHNRVQLICSQISGVAPEVSHRWSKPRLWRTAIRLQHQETLNLLPLITHRLPFDQAGELFQQLDQGTPGVLQAVLEFK